MAHEINENGNGNADPRRRLRTAFALNRGIEFQEKTATQGYKPPEHDHSRRGSYINDLYLRIHRELYQDTHGHPEDPTPAGGLDAQNPDASTQLRTILNEFGRTFYDSNGFMLSLPREGKSPHKSNRPTMERVLAETYHKLLALKPFPYGNRETLNLFIDTIARQSSFIERYGRLDLRRLSDQDVAILNNPKSSVEQLTEIFVHAVENNTPKLQNNADGFQPWPDKRIEISELPFLKYENEGKTYLVTVNGGLVELQKIKKQLETFIDQPDTRIAQLSVKPEAFLGIAAEDENGQKIDLRYKRVVDGYPIGPNGEAPLICLDANPLTGLRKKWHEQLLAFIRQEKGERYPIFSLRDESEEKSLEAAATGDMKEVLKEAAAHVREVTHQLDRAKDRLFEGKKPVEHPYLFMALGGPGSGKEAVHEIARAYCNNNYVVASLDKSREVSDIYRVLNMAGHHADDYTTVEPMASALREWVAKGARENALNVVYDGTGIPFKNRYDKIIRDYKHNKEKPGSDYKTMVCAVDTMFEHLPGRDEECASPVIPRIIKRANEDAEKRALPWVVVTSKHIMMPRALLEATEQPEVDKVVLVCNDGPLGTHYILGESFKMDAESLRSLKEAQKQGELRGALSKNMLEGKDSVALALAAAKAAKEHISPGEALSRLIKKIPAFEEDNIGFLAKRVHGREHVFVMNNVTRMVDLAEKGLLHPEASGPDTLDIKRREMAYALPSDIDLKNGATNARVALQKPPESYKAKVMQAYNSIRPERS